MPRTLQTESESETPSRAESGAANQAFADMESAFLAKEALPTKEVKPKASWLQSARAAISALYVAQEVRRSIWFSLLLLIALVAQLVADTVISILVGKVSSDLADARGTVSTISE
jgi:hypothetical protein